MNNSEILIYQNSEGNIKIDVRLEEGCSEIPNNHSVRCY